MLRVLLIVLAIPAIGFGISTWIIADVNSGLASQGLPSIQVICASEEATEDATLQAACSEFDNIRLLQRSSTYAGLLGLAIPGLIWFGSLLAGSNRARLALVFPALTRLVLLLLSVLVIMQGAILTYGAYVGESYAFERVHFVLIGCIGIGAAIAAIALVRAAFSIGKKLQTTVTGCTVSKRKAPALYGFIGDLARELGATPPKNIVIGLDPNFFVTNAEVDCLVDEKLLSGETLFVSAPLTRLLTKDEFAAVVGHELGHFRGKDTVFSMKFAPVYAGMADAIGAMDIEGEEGALGLAKIPALAVLSYMYESFSRNERSVARERELLADQAGAEVSGAFSLATALTKVSFYSAIWPSTQEKNIERLNSGKITRNLSTVFLDSAKYDIQHTQFKEILDAVLEEKIPHPTDTHPTLAERLSGLEIASDDLDVTDILPPEQSAIELLGNYRAIEEQLTLFEHRLRVTLGQVVVPKEAQQNQFLNIIYLMAAAMASADGKIDPEEIGMAEAIGEKLISEFDSVDFREACKSGDLPDFVDLVDLLKDVLDQEMKDLLYRYLEEIAKADGLVSPAERKLLAELSSGFGVALG